MEQLVFLVGFVAVILFVVFPAWILVRMGRMSRELSETRNEIAALRKNPPSPEPAAPVATQAPVAPVAPVEKTKALEAPASTVAVQPPPIVQPPPVPQAPPVLPPPPVPEKKAPEPVAAPSVAQQRAEPVVPLSPSAGGERARATPFSWEVFMGTKFLSWVGAVAAFLSVAYFLKYSIDHDLISPIVRATLGFLFGAGLIVGGLFAVRKKYAIMGHALCAAGIVSLYGVTFACRAVYDFPFFNLAATFGLMSLITAAAFVLAVRLDGKFIAVLGLLGGFLTPPLLSTGVDNPPGLFSYIALLNVGLFAVALHRRWDFLVALGAVCTALMQLGWAAKFMSEYNTHTAMIVCAAFVLLFFAGYLVARRLKRATPLHTGGVGLLSLVSFGFALHMSISTGAAFDPLWLFGFVFLVDLCVFALGAVDRRQASWASFAGAAVFVILGAWIMRMTPRSDELFNWGLGLSFVFAVLHTAFPLVLARVQKRDGENRGFGEAGAGLSAPLALVLVLIPVIVTDDMPFAVWPVILLIDLLAIVCAAMTRSIVGVVLSLILTLTTAAMWVFKIPDTLPQAPFSLLLVIGGFAVLFFAASLWLGRKFSARAGAAGGAHVGNHFNSTLPALSSLLPFLLIVMMEARLALADPTPIFGLGLLLAVLTLGLAKILRHEWLPSCALAGALAICWVWGNVAGEGAYRIEGDTVNSVWGVAAARAFAVPSLAWVIGFCAIFFAFPFVYRRAFADMRGPWITSVASLVLFFPLVHWMINSWWPNDFMGLVPAAFALPAIAGLIAVSRIDSPDHPRRLGRLALFGGAALLFVTLIFPIQFSREWITIAWALEGAALLWLHTRVPHRALPWAGAGLLGVAFVRLAFNIAVLSYHVRGDVPVWNWFLYAYGIAIACMFAGAWFLRIAKRQDPFSGGIATVLQVLGVILAFLLLNIEIADFFTEPGSYAVTLEFSGSFARDMSYTIAWALFALALLVAGIAKRQRPPRYAALALLAVVALKLAFHDLATLETLYRVAALFAVAVVMMLASFLYQKYVAPREAAKNAPPAPPAPPTPPAIPPSLPPSAS